MARSIRSLRLVSFLLLSSVAGCAQFQWSGQGPGAPGRKDAPPPVARTHAPPVPLEHDQAPAPFPTSDRERIANIQPWVDDTARRHEMDPDLINAVIWVESRFVPRAKSPAGARGLMQLMPATANAMAREMGRPMARVFDPEFNVEAGSLYLLKLLDRYDGDETLALAAYNAGAGNVKRWMAEDGELPPRSLKYVDSVQRARLRFVAMRDGRTVPGTEDDRTMIASAPAPAPAPAAKPRPEVPAPPPRRRVADRPAPNLTPAPDVYRPEPTPEPPLHDTPLVLDQPAGDGVKDEGEADVKITKPTRLPSVLD